MPFLLAAAGGVEYDIIGAAEAMASDMPGLEAMGAEGAAMGAEGAAMGTEGAAGAARRLAAALDGGTTNGFEGPGGGGGAALFVAGTPAAGRGDC